MPEPDSCAIPSVAEPHKPRRTTCRALLILLERRRACWMARPGHATQPRLCRRAATMPVPSGNLNRIALSSSNTSRRSCRSNSRSRSRSLVVVVVAGPRPRKCERRRLPPGGLRAAGRAGEQAGGTRPMVYTQPCPSQPMPRPCPGLAPHPVAPSLYTPAPAPVSRSGACERSSHRRAPGRKPYFSYSPPPFCSSSPKSTLEVS